VARDLRAPRVAVLLLDLLELLPDDRPAALLALEQAADLARALPFLVELLSDDENLELREAVDLQLEDRVGLVGGELEPFDVRLRRVGLPLGPADDLQDLVERVEDLLEAFEDVDALAERLEPVLQ